MQIDLKTIAAQVKQLWEKLSGVQRALLVTVLVAAAAYFGYLSFGQPKPQQAVLFSSLDEADAAQIVEALKADKVDYQLRPGGTITVPKAQVEELRLQIASRGIPRGGGVGFELFDRQAFATTSFVEQMNYRRALSGELSRTISSLDPIDNARVHIAMPRRSIYKQEDAKPSVSVAVRLRPGRSLSEIQLKGIVHLVTSSMSKLTPDRVSVVDEAGRILWSGSDQNNATTAQREIEKTLRERVSAITDRIVGPGQSVVVVTAQMDTTRAARTEELYDKDSAVLRSHTKTESTKFGMNNRALAGVQANLPDQAVAPPSREGKPKDSKLSETKNFEVNRIVKKIEEPEVKVAKLHIAILINGALGAETSSTGAAGSEVPGPTARDLQRVAALVREAAGLDLERGDRLEIQSIPFVGDEEVPAADEPAVAEAPLLPPWQMAILGAVTGLLFVGAFFFFRRKKEEEEEEVEEEEEEEDEEVAEEQPPPLTPRQRVREAVRMDADRAAKILSGWLREAEPSGGI